MITGEVTSDREAVVSIRVVGPSGEATVMAVIDTGFTEFLSVPPEIVDRLGLPFVTVMPMKLAGESEAGFDVHVVSVDWDGELRVIPVLKAEGAPLIGMALLRGFRLTVDGIDGGNVLIVHLEA